MSKVGDIRRAAAALAEVNAFDFADAAELNAQAQAHQQRRAGFVHGSHEGHFTGFRIGEDVLVVADALDGFPEAVAEFHGLIVLGVLDVGRERQALGIVRHQRREVLIDHAFQTRAIAIERDGPGGSVRVGSKHERGGRNRAEDDKCRAHGTLFS